MKNALKSLSFLEFNWEEMSTSLKGPSTFFITMTDCTLAKLPLTVLSLNVY